MGFRLVAGVMSQVLPLITEYQPVYWEHLRLGKPRIYGVFA